MQYDENTKVSVAMENKDVVAMFEKLAPGFQDNPMFKMAKNMPLKQVFSFLKLDSAKVKELLGQMNALVKK